MASEGQAGAAAAWAETVRAVSVDVDAERTKGQARAHDSFLHQAAAGDMRGETVEAA